MTLHLLRAAREAGSYNIPEVSQPRRPCHNLAEIVKSMSRRKWTTCAMVLSLLGAVVPDGEYRHPLAVLVRL